MLPGMDSNSPPCRTAETRHSNPQYREQPSYPQRSRTPPQYQNPPNSGVSRGSELAGNALPGYWYSAKHDTYYPLPRAAQGDESHDLNASSQGGYQDQGPINEQSVSAPPYSSQRQIRYTSAPTPRSEQVQGASSTFSRGDLAGQAIDFIMDASRGEKQNSGEGHRKRFG